MELDVAPIKDWIGIRLCRIWRFLVTRSAHTTNLVV